MGTSWEVFSPASMQGYLPGSSVCLDENTYIFACHLEPDFNQVEKWLDVVNGSEEEVYTIDNKMGGRN
jgi:hypothetical protein